MLDLSYKQGLKAFRKNSLEGRHASYIGFDLRNKKFIVLLFFLNSDLFNFNISIFETSN